MSSFARLLTKLLGGFIVIGLLMLALFSYNSWNQENQDMRNNLAIQAGFAAKNSQAVFDNIGTSMELLGRLLEKRDVVNHPEAARATLMEYQSNHPEISAVMLISPGGVMLLNTAVPPRVALPDFRKDPPYYRAFLFDINNTYSYNIGPNQLGNGLSQWHFPFRHTVQDSEGHPMFVIQGAISSESAGTLWSDLPLLPGSRVGLMRSDGYFQFLWPTGLPEQAFRRPQTDALAQILRTNPGMISGLFEGASSVDGIIRTGAYSHLPNANMAAFVSVPKRLILSHWWAHNYPVLLSFIAYLAVIGAIAFRLIGRERQHTQELVAQSRKDPLTGLPNRIAVDEILMREIARAQRSENISAVLYFDLDKFKDINDKLGHSSGDRLLERVALRIRALLRDEDILARLGGDEFLALLPNCNPEQASLVAQRILDAFIMPFPVSGYDVVVSTSIGICMFPENGDDIVTLLQNADTAMYEAKRNEGNSYAFYREELGEHIRKRLQLQHDFQRALKLQEFTLHYQPLVDMSSGKIIGAEALARWNDPECGMRNPGEFIPFAEESGLILPLGEWVFRTACLQAKHWLEQGHDFYVAVNLSTRQFQDPALLEKIGRALSEAELPPEYLELEITETVSMLDPEASIQVMNELKQLGIRIAIDDFGTGYSSLSYLKRIPADVIKIDRSFVSQILTDRDDFTIVRTILALAKALEKRCLAEGIESIEHFEMLGNLGCQYAQGYWMSKPLPATEFENLVSEGKRYTCQGQAYWLSKPEHSAALANEMG